ncbi:MAG: hypothetical protein JXR03_19830 [Cyclobacteriaceae bacterium]
MRVSLSEVWNFADIIKNEESGWSFSLHAGDAVIEKISRETLHLLRDDNDFNTELLPEIFTFREILWQPDIYPDASMSLPSLRVLESYCQEQTAQYKQSESDLHQIYAHLLKAIGEEGSLAIKRLEEKAPDAGSALSDLRKRTFPMIKFFISHPRNRLDYYRDAVNRLNYAVKIMITQFNGKFTELEEPYWEVLFDKKTSKEKEHKEKSKQSN